MTEFDITHGLSQDHPGPLEPVEVAQQSPAIRVEVEPDPRGVNVGVWDGSRCVYSGAHPIPTGATGEDGAAPSLSSLRGFAPGACDGMKSEDYVNKVRNGDWSSPHCTPAPSAPGDAQDERQDWMTCESRRPWVSNGLKAYAQELRDKERRCRTAYNKDFYGIPARYVADAYAEAAAVFESKLAAIAQQKGEA
ncbi:hypothetical protein D9M72_287350 [compost metagenome]